MILINTRVLALVYLIFLVILPCNVNAQIHGLDFGFNLSMGVPKGEFNENVENLGWGGSIYGVYNLPNSPFMVGLDIGLLSYGREVRSERFSLTIPDVTVRVVNDNNILLTHLLFRIQPDWGGTKPYFDSLFGFKNLFTTTRIESETIFDEEIAESTNSSDWALSYGLGVGLKIKVFEKFDPDKDEHFSLFIDIGMKYLWGGEAQYLKEGSIIRTTPGEVSYDFNQSETDLLLFNLGISMLF